MNREKIAALLGGVLNKPAGEIAALPPELDLTTVGLTSIQFIQFIVAVEEAFNIEVRDSDLLFSNFKTLGQIYQTLAGYFKTEPTPVKKPPVKKVLICDCDNVLWQGVAGEEPLQLTNENIALQRALVNLYNKGVLLCLCSKNQPQNIETAFKTLDMPLKPEHIILKKISFNNKVESILQIAKELNLLPESFVFLDDDPHETEAVTAVLPQVTAILANHANPNFTAQMQGCFGTGAIGQNRTELYREQKQREKARQKFGTVEEFNRSLNTKIICEPARPEQLERIAELTNRTNQFNLAGGRFTTNELAKFFSQQNCKIYSVSIADRLGDMGIIGAALVTAGGRNIITNFYLSCRAFGRGAEQVLLNTLKAHCPGRLYGVYRKTEQNKLFADFYTQNGVEIL